MEKLRRRGDVEALSKILQRRDFVRAKDGTLLDLDADKKVEAAEALGSFGEEPTTAALLPGLSSPVVWSRLAVLSALGARPEPEAGEALLAVIGSPQDARDELGRSGALQALLRREDVSALRLVQALLGGQDDLAIDDEHKATVEALLSRDEDRTATDAVTAELLDGLGNPDQGTRTRSQQLLVSLEGRAVDPAIEALQRPEARAQAAIVLGHLRDARAVPALLDALADEAPPVRVAAAWALGEVRDPSAIQQLTIATGDVAYEVRVTAGAAINKFGNVAVLAQVTALLHPLMAELGRGNETDFARAVRERRGLDPA